MTPRRPAPGTHKPGGAAQPDLPLNTTDSRGAASAVTPSTLALATGPQAVSNTNQAEDVSTARSKTEKE